MMMLLLLKTEKLLLLEGGQPVLKYATHSNRARKPGLINPRVLRAFCTKPNSKWLRESDAEGDTWVTPNVSAD